MRFDLIDITPKLWRHRLIVEGQSDQLSVIITRIELTHLIGSRRRMGEMQAASAAGEKPILVMKIPAKDQRRDSTAERTGGTICRRHDGVRHDLSRRSFL